MQDRSMIWRTFFLVGAALLILVASVPGDADIYRGCIGALGIAVISGEGVDTSSGRSKFIEEFEGRGQCNNAAQANTCRVRAKDNVFRCANDLWAARWTLIGDPNDSHPDGGIPLSCQGRATGAKGLGPFRKNPFGQFFDIKHAIEHAACCELQPTANSLHLSVDVNSIGDKGCGNDKNQTSYTERRTLEGNYVVDCQRLRAQGMCAVRTGG
jgi:hypothetical protein